MLSALANLPNMLETRRLKTSISMDFAVEVKGGDLQFEFAKKFLCPQAAAVPQSSTLNPEQSRPSDLSLPNHNHP